MASFKIPTWCLGTQRQGLSPTLCRCGNWSSESFTFLRKSWIDLDSSLHGLKDHALSRTLHYCYEELVVDHEHRWYSFWAVLFLLDHWSLHCFSWVAAACSSSCLPCLTSHSYWLLSTAALWYVDSLVHAVVTEAVSQQGPVSPSEGMINYMYESGKASYCSKQPQHVNDLTQ